MVMRVKLYSLQFNAALVGYVPFEITFSLNMDVELLFVSSTQRVLTGEQSKKAQESARELTMLCHEVRM
jgi:hypothetical protein